MKTGKLDEYAIEARVFPAFLALLPVGICASRFIGLETVLVGACSAFSRKLIYSPMRNLNNKTPQPCTYAKAGALCS